MTKIWIDVEDLFAYAVNNSRPSGIQRFEYEVCKSLVEMPGSDDFIRFVRHETEYNTFYTISWQSVERLFVDLTTKEEFPAHALAGRHALAHATDATGAARRPQNWGRRVARKLGHALPSSVGRPLRQFAVHQKKALSFAREALRASIYGVPRRLRRVYQQRRMIQQAKTASHAAEASWLRKAVAANVVSHDGIRHHPLEPFDRACQGDVLLALGSPWFANYTAMIKQAQQEKKLRFGALVYDIIPLRRPEWCDPQTIPAFAGWINNVLPLADKIFTISHATTLDLNRYAHSSGLRLRAAPRPVPVGTGIRNYTPQAGGAPPALGRLPQAGSYALIVATIEARKNHVLLLHIWRKLLEDLPADMVPTLVFAGRIGWLVGDLMQQLRNADFLGGKIIVIEDLTDLELETLYQGCKFTLFPSFYEGWGLPVSESLALGCPCIISSATSLPEAGGNLARYFDPGNGAEAYGIIRAAIENPEDLRLWRAQIRREFKPVSWSEAANAILQELLIGQAQEPPAWLVEKLDWKHA